MRSRVSFSVVADISVVHTRLLSGGLIVFDVSEPNRAQHGADLYACVKITVRSELLAA